MFVLSALITLLACGTVFSMNNNIVPNEELKLLEDKNVQILSLCKQFNELSNVESDEEVEAETSLSYCNLCKTYTEYQDFEIAVKKFCVKCIDYFMSFKSVNKPNLLKLVLYLFKKELTLINICKKEFKRKKLQEEIKETVAKFVCFVVKTGFDPYSEIELFYKNILDSHDHCEELIYILLILFRNGKTPKSPNIEEAYKFLSLLIDFKIPDALRLIDEFMKNLSFEQKTILM